MRLLDALERPLSRGRQAEVATVPFPLKGWNTRDKLQEKPEYAPVMTNLRPRAGRGIMRAGYADHATGLPSADVESLLHYDAAGTEKLFAAVDGEIYDVSSSGAVGAAAVSSLTNDRWQQTMHATSGGFYLVAVNGADGVRTYSGSAWASQTINNVTAADLISVISHKYRLWFIEKDTLSAWYLATYAISGDATELPLGAIFKHGGTLLAMGTWTIDGGSGPDDYIAFITTNGEVGVYAGTDPSDASLWSHVGTYKIDRPIGRRCAVKLGGDLAILTVSGVVLLSEVRAATDQKDTFSDPIRDEFVDAAVDGESRFGWELVLYSRYGELIANIPRSSGNYEQYLNVTINRAWWKSIGQNAICWSEFNGGLYFGGEGGLLAQADTGTTDDGAGITLDLQPSWSRFRTPLKKRFTMMRPAIFSDGTLALQGAMKVDYDESGVTAAITTVTAIAGATWDVDLWDVGVWGGAVTPRGRWATASGEGLVGAPRLRLTTTTAEVQIGPIDVAFKVGGIV